MELPKSLEQDCSDFYDMIKDKSLDEGWTSWKDINGLAFRALVVHGAITTIETKRWQDIQ